MSRETITLIQQTLKQFLIYTIYGVLILIIALPFIGTLSFNLSKLSGILAVVFFCVTQIAGIIRRFELNGVFRDIYKIVFASRAQQGILMFMFGLAHYIGIYLVPTFTLQNGVFTFTSYTIAGFFALFTTLLLAITSNVQSKKLLKHWWGRLHKLVFILSWLIAAHLIFVYSYKMTLSESIELSVLLPLIAIVGVGLLQITSLSYHAIRIKKAHNNQ